MNKYNIPLDLIKNPKELFKILSFISDDIVEINKKENFYELLLKENSNNLINIIKEVVETYKKNNNNLQDEIEWENKNKQKTFYSYNSIINSGFVKDYKNGILSFNELSVKLYNFFDNLIKEFILSLGAYEKKYPVLLPIESLIKTGYLRNSPQYIFFCCNQKEDLNTIKSINLKVQNKNIINDCYEPFFSLSPSACFHTYLEYENITLEKETLLTFKQNVFRNEGRFNWQDFGRLRDFTVREIVFFGDFNYVKNIREEILKEVKSILLRFNINSRICITHDQFVIPEMQKFKKIQLLEKSKYELQIEYEKNNFIAVASFNFHGTAFTNPFHIKIQGVETAVSGCIGFGLERMVLAYLAQFGFDPQNWSIRI